MDYRVGGKIHGIREPGAERILIKECFNCKCQWFKTVIIQKIQEFQVLLGQPALTAMDPGVFYLYQCFDCGKYNTPPLTYSGMNAERRLYEELLKIVGEVNERDEGE